VNNKLLGFSLVGIGAVLLWRSRNEASAVGALGAPPEVHRQEAVDDMKVMEQLVGETEQHVKQGHCKLALASAGKAAVAAGKVERNLPYCTSGRLQAMYAPLNDRRMKSRDAFAAQCMKKP
jgi:hypothetical protein